MIALGCDRSGVGFIRKFCGYFDDNGIEYRVFTEGSGAGEDYNDAALKVAESVVSGESRLGVLVCGTGIGMSIMANKVKGIRAAVCGDTYSAEMTRRHNDANVLCMGGKVVDRETGLKLVKIFLETEFEGGRHQRRIDQIAQIENETLQ